MSGAVELRSASGLAVQLNRNGSIRRIDHRDVLLNMYLGNELEGGPANVYLRRHDGGAIVSAALLGPCSPGTIQLDGGGFTVAGEWNGLRFTLVLVLADAAPAWFWHVRVENAGAATATVDLVYAQDLALAHYGLVRMNEYYVSQYVDYTPLAHADRGVVLAVRQNLAMGDRHPWALVGALGRGASFATDALQLHGLATRAGDRPAGLGDPTLPGRRQHEHSMAIVQETPVTFAPGGVVERGFFVWVEPDHPGATSDADLAVVARALALPEAAPPGRAPAGGKRPTPTVFSARPVLATVDLDAAALETLFGAERRQVESDDGGTLLSFFVAPRRHVVLRAKELATLRPHGQIFRTGDALVPDEASLTSTMWMSGVFHSLVTQGHVNIDRVLSTTRSYLGLLRSGGLRAFVELDDGWHLLQVPSAFEMSPTGCRWVYDHAGGRLEVTAGAATRRHELTLAFTVLLGPPRRFLLSHHVALGGDDGAERMPVRCERDARGIVVRTDPATELGRLFPDGFFRFDPDPGTVVERAEGDEALFDDGTSRGEPFLVLVTARAASASFRLTGGLIPSTASAAGGGGVGRGADRAGDGDASADRDAAAAFWTDMTGRVTFHAPASAPGAARVAEILPWFAHDALIHYLAPRGLEQYSGGGWGTRDVCQGPVELLLALGRWAPIRDVLLRVFGAQNPDGDWPQWFMPFERFRGIRASDSHGDIVYWPLLALAQYLLASDDADLLDAPVPFFHPEGDARAEHATIADHVARALGVVERRRIPATALPAYGHGDWNDALQPVDPAMRERLCSAWTATLQFQTATALAAALRRCGREQAATSPTDLAVRTRDDFQRLLLPDGTLTGFAYFHDDGRTDFLLHPRDGVTGMSYSLLPMIHAIINGMLTPEQARAHAALIGEHLLAPDGARLFDRPPEYRGGVQRLFQRAESSTFFGREIGLMYVHAHLRYAEAMARLGEAQAFYRALLQAIPIGIRDVVPNARMRQANCYASSSDAVVADRYEAQARYDDVRSGRIPVEGGWRVYSSGAGIACRLIHEVLVGVRRARATLTIDPVLPRVLDGLGVDVELDGRPVRITYAVGARGCDPVALELNGAALPFTRDGNPYRAGGAVVETTVIREHLRAAGNELRVRLA